MKLFAGEGFWDDWEAVPPEIRHAFTAFALRLQSNPYEPGLVARAQIDRRQRYVFEFTAGWIVGWRTTTESPHIIPSETDQIDMELLLIRRRS